MIAASIEEEGRITLRLRKISNEKSVLIDHIRHETLVSIHTVTFQVYIYDEACWINKPIRLSHIYTS